MPTRKKAGVKVRNSIKQALKWLAYLPQTDGRVRILRSVLTNAYKESKELKDIQ